MQLQNLRYEVRVLAYHTDSATGAGLAQGVLHKDLPCNLAGADAE
jgi:hypothetical protein